MNTNKFWNTNNTYNEINLMGMEKPHKRQFHHRIYLKLQELGKALIFPISALPVVALLLKIGYLLINHSAINSSSWWFGQILYLPSNIIFQNLGVIFCVGIAFGLSRDRRGEAALASLIGILSLNALSGQFTADVNGGTYGFSLTQLIYGEHIFDLFKNTTGGTTSLNPSEILNSGVFGGVIIGCWSAFVYNKFSNIKLHPIFLIFSGKRSVPMIIFLSIIFWGILFAIVWIWIAYSFYALGNKLTNVYHNSGSDSATAAGISAAFSFANKLLLPFGLNNIISAPFWYQIPFFDKATGITYYGDIAAFSNGVQGSGIFQTGFFLPTLFGLPAASIAMILLADQENKKATIGLLGGAAFVSFVSGVSEPLEYSFLYIAPLLFGIHTIFTAIGSFFIILLKVYVGFGFRPGIIDYIISYPISLSLSAHWWTPLLIFPIGILIGLMYFGTFYILIKKLNLPTLGRGNNSSSLNILNNDDDVNNQHKRSGGKKISLPNLHLPM